MTLIPWQRTNILGAHNYLKEIARIGKDSRAGSLAQGLAEVLEPARRTLRLQREAAHSAAAGARAGRERRYGADRRHTDRRQKQIELVGIDRRSGAERRSKDRRGPS